MRNDAKYNGIPFDLEVLYTKVIRSVAARKNIEDRLTQITKIPRIDELYRALVLVKNLNFLRADTVR